jgi:hypothetical protein
MEMITIGRDTGDPAVKYLRDDYQPCPKDLHPTALRTGMKVSMGFGEYEREMTVQVIERVD